jgi:hypothetical protein
MTARGRYLVLTLSRIVIAAGTVFGVVLLGRATTTGPKVLGIAIVLAGLAVMAIVPRHLARRWRTPTA